MNTKYPEYSTWYNIQWMKQIPTYIVYNSICLIITGLWKYEFALKFAV